MQRIILGFITIIGASALIVSGGTGAFFSDTETSTGNTFAAGAIDLKIDNESYYNGNRCTNVGSTSTPVWQWQGEASFPIPGTSCTTSFLLSDLDSGLLFFDFADLKPDDEGEDTISIHVENDAWACMDLTLASNDDNSSTEPELESLDAQDEVNDVWDGELAQNLQFFWWADDGDNVYEEGENMLSNGVETLTSLATSSGSFRVTLADSVSNAWGEEGAPLPGGETVYIGKAWCFGTLTPDPVGAGQGVNPSVDPGVNCDGTILGNETQTDGAEINVTFSAVQARHNSEFLCNPRDPQTVTLTVNKIITADTVGIGVEDFELHIVGPNGDQIVSDNIPVAGLPAGDYTVYEVILSDRLPPGVTFTSTIGGACNLLGEVTLNPGDNLVCTINNIENQ